VVVLGLSQLLLPGLAAQRVRDKIGRYGVVHSATVHAFPAIQLLWGSAQSATVHAGALDMTSAQASELLWETRHIPRIDMHAESMRVGSFTLQQMSWEKRGEVLSTQGTVAETALRAAIPGSASVQLLGNTPAGVEIRVSGNLFGINAAVDVLLSAQNGKLVAQPQGIPFAGFVKVTVLSEPHLYVRSIGLTPVGGSHAEAPGGGGVSGENPSYHVNIGATLH
jgi:hypothetical protein